MFIVTDENNTELEYLSTHVDDTSVFSDLRLKKVTFYLLASKQKND